MTNVTSPPSTSPDPGTTRGALPVWPSVLGALSLLTLFVGARLLVEPNAAMLAVAIALNVGAAWGRRPARSVGNDLSEAGVALLQSRAFAAHLVVAVGGALLVVLARNDSPGHDTLGDDARNIALSLALVCALGGGAVLGLLELLMAQARPSGVVESARVRRAVHTAVTLLSALGFLGGATYAVHKADVRFDLAYAAPTTPSGATLALLDTAACGDAREKPEVFLFFERGSSAVVEVNDYFARLGEHGARVTTLDQALDPALAKALKITKNGTIGLRCGERTETWVLGADRDEAQKKLAKLDGEVRARLGKISRDPVNVYFTVGHGERSVDESDSSGRAPGKALKRLLEGRNAKPKKLGLADGLSQKVPDDAGLVVVFGPTKAFLLEEAQALASFVDGGGAVALLLDPPTPARSTMTTTATNDSSGAAPGGDDVAGSLRPLLVSLGVDVGGSVVLNDKEYVKQSGTDADHAFVFATSFGTHKSVKTLSGARGKAALLFQQAQRVLRPEGGADDGRKISFLARTRPASWEDTIADGRFSEGPDAATREKRDILDLAAAIEKKVGDKEARALVVGDADVLGDTLLSNEANAVFAWEAFQWLLRDDDAPAGAVTVDEDVPIRHTRDEDTAWFYGTTVGAPALVLVAGALSLRWRRRRRTQTAAATTNGARGANGGAP